MCSFCTMDTNSRKHNNDDETDNVCMWCDIRTLLHLHSIPAEGRNFQKAQHISCMHAYFTFRTHIGIKFSAPTTLSAIRYGHGIHFRVCVSALLKLLIHIISRKIHYFLFGAFSHYRLLRLPHKTMSLRWLTFNTNISTTCYYTTIMVMVRLLICACTRISKKEANH